MALRLILALASLASVSAQCTPTTTVIANSKGYKLTPAAGQFCSNTIGSYAFQIDTGYSTLNDYTTACYPSNTQCPWLYTAGCSYQSSQFEPATESFSYTFFCDSGCTQVSACSTLNCVAGQYLAQGGMTCSSCSPGQYSNTAGATACTACESGKYANTSAATACQPCTLCTERGKYKKGCGATSAGTCEMCS